MKRERERERQTDRQTDREREREGEDRERERDKKIDKRGMLCERGVRDASTTYHFVVKLTQAYQDTAH